MYAVIKTGGKQYQVKVGDVVFVEKIDAEAGAEIKFNDVLAIGDDGKFTAGAPTVEGASVSAKVLSQTKGKKIIVFKYKAKKNLWRIPEATLLTIALIGGSLGSLLGMYTIRHKTKHLKFTVGIPVILIGQLLLYLLMRQ